MKRGEVRWTNLPAPISRRPAVVLSRNSTLGVLNTVTVAPVTTQLRELRSRVYLDEDDGLPKPCNATLHDIVTVRKEALQELITVLSQERIEEIEAAISYALGFGEIV